MPAVTVTTEGREGLAPGDDVCTIALKPANIDVEGAKGVPIPRARETAESHRKLDEAASHASACAALAKAGGSAVESTERLEAYERAANWKKPAEPGSMEAFMIEKARSPSPHTLPQPLLSMRASHP